MHLSMNPAYTEAALTQARSDIRTIVDRNCVEHSILGLWHPLGTLATLILTLCRQAKGIGHAGSLFQDPGKWLSAQERSAIGQARAERLTLLVDATESGLIESSEAMKEELDQKKGLYDLVMNRMELYDSGDEAVRSRRLLDWLGGLDLRTREGRRCAADVFEDTVRHEVEWESALGKFVTPEPVAKLMLELAEIEPGQSVHDPCFGFGEFLVGAGRRQRETAASAQILSVPRFVISGIENDRLALRVTQCRMVLAGFDGVSLELNDALAKPLPRDGADTGFDRILAAPPWGRESIGSRYEHFPFPGIRAEDLFLQHVMAHLRPGGRAVVALPERSLLHAESSELRKDLLSRYCVEGVIALPAGAFEPCTTVAASLVVFSRAKPRDTVWFVTVSPAAWEASPEDTPLMPRRVGPVDADSRYVEAFDRERERERPRFAHGEWLPDSSISATIGERRELPVDQMAMGVRSWAVPVQELVRRDCELAPKETGSDALDVELNWLAKTGRGVQVKRLDEVATVSTSRFSSGYRPSGSLLRPHDVTDDGLRELSGDLDNMDGVHVWNFEFLKLGDLLVPMSETVGNICLFNRHVDTLTMDYDDGVVVDQRIAVVRVHDGIRRQYLAALLRSPVYWFWLTGHATGSPNPSLSTEVFKALKVPVPPLDVQDDVVKDLSGLRADALAVLHRKLAGADRHPVTLWLERQFAGYLAAGVSGPDALERFAVEIPPLALSAANAIVDDRSTGGSWLKAAGRAAAALVDFGSVPASSGRLVILEHAGAELRRALGVVGSNEMIDERLRSVTLALMGIVQEEVNYLQEKGRLEIAAEPAEIQVGATDEVRLQVINASPVPLRKVRVNARQANETDGKDFGEVSSYLAEGKKVEIPLAVRAQDATQPLQIEVAWQARRLDATPVQGETQVSVLVRAGAEAAATGDLGYSPYIVGNPVDRDEMFFGRDGIMDQIRRHLGDRADVILLEGNRRTGKTSILKQLEKEDALPGWVPVYCSFQDLDSMATPNVFRLLAKQTGWALADAGIETWIPDQPASESGRPFKWAFLSATRHAFSDDHPYETLALYLSEAVEAVKPRRILLMLDEFDKLQEGIDRGKTSSQVTENIRHLLQHQSGLGAIITGSRRLKRLREEYWSALFGFGHRIGVSALPEAEARRLVTEPVAPRIRYLPQACDLVVALCARHPFLIQSLCSRVFDLAAAGSERTITGDVVERAATEMVRDNEHFRTLWGYAGSERRRLILALSPRLEDSAAAVNLDLIAMKIAEHGVPVRDDKALADDVTELRELELLEIDESYRGGTYRLSIPLMAKWMRLNVDFKDLVKRARREARRDA